MPWLVVGGDDGVAGSGTNECGAVCDGEVATEGIELKEWEVVLDIPKKSDCSLEIFRVSVNNNLDFLTSVFFFATSRLALHC